MIHPQAKKQAGFTIIEVLIVLAIVGLILLIVFLAVPAAQRNQRNVARKHAVDYVAAQMITFTNERGQYPYSGPSAPDLRTQFVNEIKAEGPGQFYDIRYTDNDGSHNYPYSGPSIPGSPNEVDGEISIVPAHWCNRSGAGPGDNDFPLTGTATDMDFTRYAVYIVLEPSNQIYCIDTKN